MWMFTARRPCRQEQPGFVADEAVRRILRQALQRSVKQVSAVGQVQILRHALPIGNVIQLKAIAYQRIDCRCQAYRLVHLGQDGAGQIAPPPHPGRRRARRRRACRRGWWR